jgi:trafficking protein particle complex subunit 1
MNGLDSFLMFSHHCVGLRHCACIYYQDWYRTKRPKPAAEGAMMPGIADSISSRPSSLQDSIPATSSYSSPRTTLQPASGILIAQQSVMTPSVATNSAGFAQTQSQSSAPAPSGLPFDEEAKLVFGVVTSLRTMIKKLSGKYVCLSLANHCPCTRTAS